MRTGEWRGLLVASPAEGPDQVIVAFPFEVPLAVQLHQRVSVPDRPRVRRGAQWAKKKKGDRSGTDGKNGYGKNGSWMQSGNKNGAPERIIAAEPQSSSRQPQQRLSRSLSRSRSRAENTCVKPRPPLPQRTPPGNKPDANPIPNAHHPPAPQE
jgi:hypothetical protein